MGVTISTHNGSAVAREHNIRNRKVTDKEGHIDPQGKHEIWIDEKPKAAYDRLFGKYVEKYNEKQKRADRKIKDYYQQICNDKKKHPVYEMIITVGHSMNYLGDEPDLDKQTTKEILRRFVDDWEKRNPHLALIGAYYHDDEQGAPHAHLDYIPVANGYKRGMETQSALAKALEQQGFNKDGKETAQIQWERRENAYLESLCLSKGIEVEHPRIADRQHLETETYQAERDLDILRAEEEAYHFVALELKEENSLLEREKEQLDSHIQDSRESIEHLDTKLQAIKKELWDSRESLEQTKQQLTETQNALNEARQAKQQALDEVDTIKSSILAEIKPPKKMFAKKVEVTEDTLNYIKRVNKRVSEVLERTQATKQALEEAQRAEERAKAKEKEVSARLDQLDKEVELRAERKISAAKYELERATKEYQQATTAVKQRFTKAVADGIAEGIKKVTDRKKEALNSLAEFCNNLKMTVGNETITVWQAYTRSWNSTLETRSIKLIEEIYEIGSKLEKQNKAATEKAPELPKRRNEREL